MKNTQNISKMLCQSRSRGFTLIELLIVIAIIGILASVVMASLNSARLKGSDAAIKSNLNSIRSQAAIWYDDNGQVYGAAAPAPEDCLTFSTDWFSMFNDSRIFEEISAAYTLSGGAANSRCIATGDVWAAAVQLKTSDGDTGPNADAWCVDSVGSARATFYQPMGPSFPAGVSLDTTISLGDFSCVSSE